MELPHVWAPCHPMTPWGHGLFHDFAAWYKYLESVCRSIQTWTITNHGQNTLDIQLDFGSIYPVEHHDLKKHGRTWESQSIRPFSKCFKPTPLGGVRKYQRLKTVEVHFWQFHTNVNIPSPISYIPIPASNTLEESNIVIPMSFTYNTYQYLLARSFQKFGGKRLD